MTAVLDHAIKWQFDTVRDAVIQEMRERCSLAEQIATARRLDMRDWVFNASLELCERAQPITLDRKSTRLNSSHSGESRMPSSA